MWPGLQKPDIIAHFSNSILLHFYNLHTQMYVLAKFQLYILKGFEVTALQSNSNRKIDLYSTPAENTLKALHKTDVTYKWSEVRTRILHHHVRHELRNGLLVKLFLLLSCITTNKVEIHEETSIATTVSTSREQTAITCNSLSTLQPNKDFRAPLAWANTMIPSF